MQYRFASDNAVLVDTSAVRALLCTEDQWHAKALEFWTASKGLYHFVCIVDSSHEVFTNVRYRKPRRASAQEALEHYWFYRRDANIELLDLQSSDEGEALLLLEKYSDHVLSFHDAMCAAVMLRLGVVKAFSFDDDFATLGVERLPFW